MLEGSAASTRKAAESGELRVQIKRMHEYKRQLLNVMHIVHEYLSLIEDGTEPVTPRTYLFAGKAAPEQDNEKKKRGDDIRRPTGTSGPSPR